MDLTHVRPSPRRPGKSPDWGAGGKDVCVFENPNRMGGDLGLKIQTKNVGVCYSGEINTEPQEPRA